MSTQTRIFQCPSCKEYIASDAKACRFCSTPIDAQTAQAAANAQAVENKQYRRKNYARHMMTGGGLCALGLIITIGSYIIAASGEGGGRYMMMYGLVIVGAGNFLYGLVGWLGELKKDGA